MKLLALFFVLPLAARADMIFSIEYPAHLAVLRKLKNAYEQAAHRADKSLGQITPIYDDSGTATPYTLSCAEGQPVNDSGCEVLISTRAWSSAGAARVTFAKSYEAAVFNEALARVEALLQTNANPVDDNDHRHLGHPFNNKSGDGSHLYCTSTGVRPHKTWSCFIYFTERIKSSN